MIVKAIFCHLDFQKLRTIGYQILNIIVMKKEIFDENLFGWRLNYPTSKIYSCKDAAQILQLPQQIIYSLRKEGKLEYFEFQGMYFFPKAVVIKWLKENQPHRLLSRSIFKGNPVRGILYYLNILMWFFK